MNNNYQDLNRRILRFFLRETRSIGDLIHYCEGIEKYPRRLIRTVVYALEKSNLLDSWGATSGTTYRTSRLGWIILVSIESKSLADKSPRLGHSRIDYN